MTSSSTEIFYLIPSNDLLLQVIIIRKNNSMMIMIPLNEVQRSKQTNLVLSLKFLLADIIFFKIRFNPLKGVYPLKGGFIPLRV